MFRRLTITLPVALVLVLLAVFSVPNLTGLDPAQATLRARFADPNPDPAAVEALRKELGLDQNATSRIVRFGMRVLRGDFGLSYVSRLPAWPAALNAFRISLLLILFTMVLATTLGCGLGVIAASGKRSVRWLAGAICVLGGSFPPHVLGPLCVLVFGIWFRLLPTGGWGGFRSMVLPIGVLMIGPMATIGEIVRVEMNEALGASFVRTATAKGLSRRRVLVHAFAVSRHGAIALSGVMLTGLVSGSVLVETLFSVPGVGRMLVDGVRNSDVPVIQATLTLAVGFSVVVSALMDAGSRFVDPRLR